MGMFGKGFGDALRHRLRRNRGVSLLEYVVIVGLVSVIAISTITSVGSSTNSLFGDVSDSMGAVVGAGQPTLSIPAFPTDVGPGGSVVTVSIPADLGPGDITITTGGDAEVGESGAGPFGGSVTVTPGDTIAVSLPSDQPGQTFTGDLNVPGIGTVDVSVTLAPSSGGSFRFHTVLYGSGTSTRV